MNYKRFNEPWQMNSNATLKILKEDARKGSLKRQEGNSEGTRTKNSKACTGVQGGQEAQSKGNNLPAWPGRMEAYG